MTVLLIWQMSGNVKFYKIENPDEELYNNLIFSNGFYINLTSDDSVNKVYEGATNFINENLHELDSFIKEMDENNLPLSGPYDVVVTSGFYF